MNHLPLKPMKIKLGSCKHFSTIRGDICKSRCTTGINDTGGIIRLGTLSDIIRLGTLSDIIRLGTLSDIIRLGTLSDILIEHFFYLLVSATPVVHLELRISANFRKKLETPLMVYSVA
jgi:hypothetical protein